MMGEKEKTKKTLTQVIIKQCFYGKKNAFMELKHEMI